VDAMLHAIEDRYRLIDISPGRLEDFRLGQGTPADPGLLVEESGWSLYCLDFAQRNAVFVQLSPEADLADAAFSGAKQFQEARRVGLLPFAALEGISRRVAPPQSLIFIFSMGRCGTTLANRMLNEVEGVWSLSEPDVHFDIAMKRAELDHNEALMLVRAATRLLFRPPARRRSHTMAIKLRGQTLFQAKTFHAAFPDAKNVFMYRDGASWANSNYQLGQRLGIAKEYDVETRKFVWFMVSAATNPAYLGPFFDMAGPSVCADQLFAPAWALYIDEYQRLVADGMPFLAIRYDELSRDRETTALRLLEHCGLPAGELGAVLEVFEEDSQAGSSIARSRAAISFTPEDYDRFRATLALHPRVKSPDVLLPDSYRGA